MPPPMGEWFQSLPSAIGSLCHIANAQHSNTLKLIRHYRLKCSRYKGVVEKTRAAMKELEMWGVSPGAVAYQLTAALVGRT